MEILKSNFTISELRDMWSRRELSVNKSYQRSPSVWPESAQTYLIDTILNKYVVPKVYFFQIYDKTRKKVVREIVDGQQRITTILNYLDDKFALTKRSEKYAGKRFSDLDPQLQEIFLTFSIEADVIYSADTADLLAMFTRMNAYTAPLNPAEKRHAQYEGPFKWFILESSATYGKQLVELGVLTSKQSVRMIDAEFLTELAIVLDSGVVDKSERSLDSIYKKYNKSFAAEDEYASKFSEFLTLLSEDFSALRGTYILKPYVCHSLFCALMQRKYGIPDNDELQIPVMGNFYTDLNQTIINLERLAGAHEAQDTEGEYSEYVKACLSTTHRVRQRFIRARWLGQCLI